MKRINCYYCGKEFNSVYGQFYCGQECRLKARRELNRDYRRQQRTAACRMKYKNHNLQNSIDAAREIGLSYGQYMARKDRER